MKVKAYTKRENRNRADLVSAWEIYNLKKKNPKEYKGRTYYSTHYNQEDIREMIHVNGRGNKQNPFFQYKNATEDHDGGEGITHQYVKEIIGDLKVLNFMINNKPIVIHATESKLEYRFDTNNGTFQVDIFVEFEKSYPIDYLDKWLGVLAIEIYDTHKTGEEKSLALEKHGIPVIEVKIPDSFDLSGIYENERLLDKKLGDIKRMYENKIYGKLLSDPESEYYRLKKQNKMLLNEITDIKQKISIYNEENSLLQSKCRKLTERITSIEKDKNYLLTQLECAKRNIKELEQEHEQKKQESWWKRLFGPVKKYK
ncbi:MULTISPECIES: hypothetical protein [Brevibacillus]|uniref:hypothetical protein n=1 Tax=Brevibacillus TaxID=55080 RepID=UPI000D112E49|nr:MULTISPECIES: hypothetical protein [Brevibacillus]MED1943938.1 hypothetical protein [Brevibacillus formosus]MED1999690.1 hypothetical protein [Brevibacillus formosus]MED2082173.1 hypothetical protein [Brevibacillus formosus]PSK18900.1 hypothetical protein C7R94_08915 [Brevibacillus sp. NRRL NRS-603]